MLLGVCLPVYIYAYIVGPKLPPRVYVANRTDIRFVSISCVFWGLYK